MPPLPELALRRLPVAGLVALVCVSLPACGGESAEAEVRAAWEEASQALAAGSATNFCGLVSAEGKEAIRTAPACRARMRSG